MQNAVGLGGVGVIVLPSEVAGAVMPPDGARSVTSQLPSARPGEKELAQLAELINSSKKIALFYGIRCADARDEVVALAEKLKAPVGHSYRGKPFIEYDNPYEVGMNGLLGFGATYDAIHECDLLLLLGRIFLMTNSCLRSTRSSRLTFGSGTWAAEANWILGFGAMCEKLSARFYRWWTPRQIGPSWTR